MEKRLVLPAVIALVAAAAIVYLAAVSIPGGAPITPIETRVVTVTVTAEPVTPTQWSMAPSARIESGVVAPEVAKLLESITQPGVRGSPVLTTVVTAVEAVPLRAGVVGGYGAPGGETGTLVAIRGVDEIDTVKLIHDILYVARDGLVYRVNTTSLEPLEPLDPLGIARASWGKASISITLPEASISNITLPASIELRGILYTWDGIAALLDVRYEGIGVGRSWTGIIVYNNDGDVVCKTLIPGRLVDARSAHGLIWVETTSPLYTVMLVGGPQVTRAVAAYQPSIEVAVINATSCEASILRFNVTSSWRAPLLLVNASGRDAYLAFSGWGPKGSVKTVVVRLVYNGTLYAVNGAELDGLLPTNWLAAALLGDRLLLVLERKDGGFTLYMLDGETLETKASLEVPRFRERVHAIRLIDGYIYVVTYRNKDPLFVINVTNPDEPRLLGWRKGPGYDQILQPLWDGLVLGLGYTDEGSLRLRVYRIESNASLALVDELVLHKTWSSVLSRPEAYRYLAIARGAIGYPVYTPEGPKGEKVLLARIDNEGHIEAYKLLVGLRAVGSLDKLYVISEGKVSVVDAATLSVKGEASLSPSSP
ncbi:beta-propeller domain-containing protein [Pyrolobus fumarii]|nr:beta-propeller domain-containing protein [Pyrolobus fumarii]